MFRKPNELRTDGWPTRTTAVGARRGSAYGMMRAIGMGAALAKLPPAGTAQLWQRVAPWPPSIWDHYRVRK